MKRYALDGALLTETPEVEVGDKIYKVDNRTSNVNRLQEIRQDDESALLEVAFGKQAAQEIMALDMPFPAMKELLLITTAAMTGETVEEVRSRFHSALV